MKIQLWHVFVIMTVLCWGTYVPTLHHGQAGMGNCKNAAFKAFLFVGLSYVFVSLLVFLYTRIAPDGVAVTGRGAGFSLFAGVLGACGALGIVLALRNGGSPLTVPPLVFAGAPIMATIVAMMWDKSGATPKWPFYFGILMAACGAALVLRYKPKAPPKQPVAAVQAEQPAGELE